MLRYSKCLQQVHHRRSFRENTTLPLECRLFGPELLIDFSFGQYMRYCPFCSMLSTFFFSWFLMFLFTIFSVVLSALSSFHPFALITEKKIPFYVCTIKKNNKTLYIRNTFNRLFDLGDFLFSFSYWSCFCRCGYFSFSLFLLLYRLLPDL